MSNKVKRKKRTKASLLYLVCIGITILLFMGAFTWSTFSERIRVEDKARERGKNNLNLLEANSSPNSHKKLSIREILSNLPDNLLAYNGEVVGYVAHSCNIASSNMNIPPNWQVRREFLSRKVIGSAMLTIKSSLNYFNVVKSCLTGLSDKIEFSKGYNKETLKTTILLILHDSSLGTYVENILKYKELFQQKFESSFFTKHEQELNIWDDLITDIANKFNKSTLELIDIYNNIDKSDMGYTDIVSSISVFKNTAVIIPLYIILDTLDYFYIVEAETENEEKAIKLIIRKDLVETEMFNLLGMYNTYFGNMLMDILRHSNNYENLVIENEGNNGEKMYELIGKVDLLANELMSSLDVLFTTGSLQYIDGP